MDDNMYYEEDPEDYFDCYEHFTKEDWDDKKFVMQTLKMDPYALSLVSLRLRNDVEVVDMVFKQENHYYLFCHVGERLRDDEDFMYRILKKAKKWEECIWLYVSKEIRERNEYSYEIFLHNYETKNIK